MMRGAFIAMSRSQRLKSLTTSSSLASRTARRFVAGEELEEGIAAALDLNAAGMQVTLDHLGENVTTRAEAERSRDAYLRLLDQIRASGVDSGISLKLTSLGFDLGDDVAMAMLRGVLDHAKAGGPEPIFVRIDMEGSDYTQRTMDIFYDVFTEYGKSVGIVIQSYLYRSDDDIERLIDLGAWVRLVKGAYLESPEIAYPDKNDVDKAFIRQTERLLSDEALANGVFTGVASQDSAIIDWTNRHAAERGIPKDAYEFQFLYGVRRDLQRRLVAEGHRMRIYVPYGRQWYPYFMRRLAERPQNVVFLARNIVREMVP